MVNNQLPSNHLTNSIIHFVFCPLSFALLRATSYEYMQNKPNLPDAQMNVSFFYTTDYENTNDRTLGENKPKQSQFQTRSEAEIPTVELL